MVLESNRDLVLRRLLECLGRDRTKHQVAEVTSLGLVQMTRKRVGQGLLEVFSETCEACNGRGYHIHTEPVEKSNGGNGGGGGERKSSRGGGGRTRGPAEARPGQGGGAGTTAASESPGGRRGPGRARGVGVHAGAGAAAEPAGQAAAEAATDAVAEPRHEGPAAPPQGRQPGHHAVDTGRTGGRRFDPAAPPFVPLTVPPTGAERRRRARVPVTGRRDPQNAESEPSPRGVRDRPSRWPPGEGCRRRRPRDRPAARPSRAPPSSCPSCSWSTATSVTTDKAELAKVTVTVEVVAAHQGPQDRHPEVQEQDRLPQAAGSPPEAHAGQGHRHRDRFQEEVSPTLPRSAHVVER